MKTYLISIVIALIIGGFIGWSLKPDKKCPEAQTKIEYKYVTATDTIIIPKFYTKKDTIKITQLDTFYIDNQYIAEVDTTFSDSLLTAKIKYISDIPLSLKSYFDLNFKVREKIITKTIEVEKEHSFWDNRFIPYIGIGLGYNGKTIEPNAQIGFGVRIN